MPQFTIYLIQLFYKMKKLNLKLVIAVAFGLFVCVSQSDAQKLKSLLNKVTENQTVKKAVEYVKTDTTIRNTVEAVKGSVIQTVSAKVDELSKPKAAEPAQVAPAKALAPDVKNSISDIRAITGLTQADLDAKMKALGFAVGTDALALGGVVYTSATAGYTLAVKMGTRNNISYVREVTKATVTKKAVLSTAKANFLKLGTQATDLKAKFTGATITAKSTKGTNVVVTTDADRTSKFLPALTKYTTNKENGTVTDAYAETDYSYSLKYSQSTVKAVSTVVTYITVADLTATAL